ncbi:MAG: hypothetical protein KDK39_20065 [Leptospiraceae bacterium]|nr:hypothetical protein [Leptospiraceae bacterium]
MLDIYDEAVNLYYKTPRDPETAAALLKQACACHPDRQDTSCYNYGVILELEEQYDAARSAYKQAWTRRPETAYELALQRLDANVHTPDARQKQIQLLIAACQKPANSAAAARQMQSLLQTTPLADRPTRSVIDQPYFRDCLAGHPEYRHWLAQLPADQWTPAEFRQQWVQGRSDPHPFNGLLDIQLYLKGQLFSQPSSRAITQSWQKLVQFGRQGQAGAAAEQLRQLFNQLDSAAARDASLHTRTRAIKRAIALLVEQEDWFAPVRAHMAIQKLIQPVLQ